MGVYSKALEELKKTRIQLEKALSSATRKNAEMKSQEGALKSAIRERGAWMATALKNSSPSVPMPIACTVLEAETEITKLLGKIILSPSKPFDTLESAAATSSPSLSADVDKTPTLTHFQHIRDRITPDLLETVKTWTWQDYNNRATQFVR